jgi:hypothetical protein
MTKRYKATRSLHYVADDGTDRLVAEGDWVDDVTDAQAAELAADGFIRESRAKD